MHDTGGNANGGNPTGTPNVASTVVFDQPPIANTDTGTTSEDGRLTVDAASGVLANDSDPDAFDTISVTAGTFATAHGLIKFAADGSYVYAPATNYSSPVDPNTLVVTPDTVQYTVTDNHGVSSTGTLNITVNAVADGPNLRVGSDDPQPDFIGVQLAGNSAHTARLSDSGFVMVWRGNGGNGDILGYTFQSNGDFKNYSGGALLIAGTGNAEFDPSVAALSNDRFSVAWAESAGGVYNIYGNIYGPLGAEGAPVLLGASTNTTFAPQTESAALTGGGYVVTWVNSGASHSEIYASIINSSGALTSTFNLSNTGTADETNPAIAALSGDRFVATWVEQGSPGQVVVKLFDAAGNPGNGGNFNVGNTPATESDNNIAPDVTVLSNGQILVTWSAPDGTELANIFGQLLNNDGTASGSVLTLVHGISTAPNGYNDFNPSVSALPGGGFALTWERPEISANDFGTVTQIFNNAGVAVTGETHVTPPDNNGFSDLNAEATALDAGRYLLTWDNNGTIHTQIEDVGGPALPIVQSGQSIALPTTVSLFDGSEVLDAIIVQGLDDNGYTLNVGHLSSNPAYDLGLYLGGAWVIDGSGDDGSDAAAEQAFLASMLSDPSGTHIHRRQHEGKVLQPEYRRPPDVTVEREHRAGCQRRQRDRGRKGRYQQRHWRH